MNLRKRLTLYSTATFGIVFLVASMVIFLAFFKRSQNILFSDLKSTTLLSAIYYLEQDELPQSEHSLIKDQFRATIQSTNVAVYNEQNKVEFGQLINDINITPTILNQVRELHNYHFKSDNYFYYGIFYPDNQGDFVVFVKVSNNEFIAQIRSLLFILLGVFLLGLITIYFLSKNISNVAYKPIKRIVQQVNKVNYSNLEQGIVVPQTQDELAELVSTYNNLLSRLSESFLIQKNFINYVSHEFKTPLTAISGNLEVFAQKERTPAEYQKVTIDALENVYKIESILSNLLLLSGLNTKDYNIDDVRIDELVWDIYDNLQDKIQEYKTQLNINIEIEDFNILKIKGNKTLLNVAFYNIIENAIKYSNNNPIDITFKVLHNKLTIEILDHGKGIHPEELPHIKETFYRGKNVGNIKGSGIGLSLAMIIFDQHHIIFQIDSELLIGTKISLTF